MRIEPTPAAEHAVAELELPTGCVVCGGPLAVRITPNGARGCCVRCRYLPALQIEQVGDQLRVVHGAAGTA